MEGGGWRGTTAMRHSRIASDRYAQIDRRQTYRESAGDGEDNDLLALERVGRELRGCGLGCRSGCDGGDEMARYVRTPQAE